MPSIPIIMPQLGESIAEATIVSLLVKVGDQVHTDQDIIEVETNKATMNVASPCPGRVEKFLVKLNESYPVGAVLGYLEASKEDSARLGLDAPTPQENGEGTETGPGPSAQLQTEATRKRVQPTVRGLPVPANATGASYMSPRMKARMMELGLHAADAMRRSWTRPLATVALPVCFDPLLTHRKASDPKPGPALYALRALAVALAENRDRKSTRLNSSHGYISY